MSLGDRCDEIVRLIDEVLGDRPQAPPEARQRTIRETRPAGTAEPGLTRS